MIHPFTKNSFSNLHCYGLTLTILTVTAGFVMNIPVLSFSNAYFGLN